jgi:aryl-alcohol dehydrogenase-like predicted oxidoreductase
VTERFELAPRYSVSRVINGLWQLSRGHHAEAVDPREAVRTLLRLVDAGFTTFDCADIYLGVEELLGLLLRELKAAHQDPAAVQIHTKYVPDRSALVALKRADVARAIEGSLARLGVERLDLVQLHWWDYDQLGFLEVAGWLSELQNEGKIRCLGTTNIDTPRLETLIGAGIPIVTNQAQYSLLDRRVEGSMAPLCKDHGIRLLCYGVLAGGFLTDNYLGVPKPQPPFENRSLTKYKLIIDEFGGWGLFQELLEVLHEIALRHASSIAAVATRWALERGSVAAVMVGVRSDAHLDDTLRVFGLRLDDEDRNRIDTFLARAEGPTGDPFELERSPESRHSQIMWTDLNRKRDS